MFIIFIIWIVMKCAQNREKNWKSNITSNHQHFIICFCGHLANIVFRVLAPQFASLPELA